MIRQLKSLMSILAVRDRVRELWQLKGSNKMAMWKGHVGNGDDSNIRCMLWSRFTAGDVTIASDARSLYRARQFAVRGEGVSNTRKGNFRSSACSLLHSDLINKAFCGMFAWAKDCIKGDTMTKYSTENRRAGSLPLTLPYDFLKHIINNKWMLYKKNQRKKMDGQCL